MSNEIKNIFISHIHEDDDRLPALKEMLARRGYEVRDGSINSSKPNDAKNEDYIMREKLAPRIDWAGALVVLVSHGTHESDWVDRESSTRSAMTNESLASGTVALRMPTFQKL